jgi:hypothetical protein
LVYPSAQAAASSTLPYLWDACALSAACKLPAVVAAHQRAILINAALAQRRKPGGTHSSRETAVSKATKIYRYTAQH